MEEEGSREGDGVGRLNSGVILSVNSGFTGNSIFTGNTQLTGSAGSLNGSAGINGKVTSNATTISRDKRPEQLAVTGLVLSMLSFVLAVVAVCTSEWARSNNLATLAGVMAIVTAILSLVSLVLAGAVLAMHRTETKVFVKFKKATTMRMVATALAGFTSFSSVILFVMYTLQGSSYSMAWGFYVEVLTMLLLWVTGGEAGAQWHKSRKLGGDPTMRGDPRGIHAHTISNPNFRDTSSNINEMSKSPSPTPAIPLTPLEVHRNGDLATTQISGQPYMLGVNGHVKPAVNGKVNNRMVSKTNGRTNPKANGKPSVKISSPREGRTSTPSPSQRKKATKQAIIANRQATMSSRPVVNKTASNKIILNRGSLKRGLEGADEVIVAFDPARTPARSSMRKPKKEHLQQTASSDAGSNGASPVPPDTPDGVAPEGGGIPNPAFAQSSPPPAKKKVRIHTQSTAV